MSAEKYFGIKIIVDSEQVHERSGEGARGPWTIRTQDAWVDLGEKYPQRIRIRIGRNGLGYAKGEYKVDLAASCYVNRYGTLAIGEELVLTPVEAK